MQYKNVVLTNTTIGAFMALLDSNIVLISLPTIIRDLPDTTTFDGIWVIMGYTLITATLLLSFGRLADIYGRVKLYNLGFAIFTIGSGLCSISPNGTSLVIFRLAQGTGGALVFANNAAILTDAFPPTERGRAIGLNQVAGTAGSVLGLVAGGVLTAYLGWRSIFWINLPVGGFATTWAYLRLKEVGARARGERLDPLGNGLFALGLSVFLIALTFGALSGWSFVYVGAMAIGLFFLAGFGIAEFRVKHPMMDLSLFRIRVFTAGIISNLLAAIARGAVSLVLVIYFQGALGLDALTAGILLIPFALAFVSIGPLSGHLSDKYGSRGFATAGLLLLSVALFWFAVFPFGAPYGLLVLPMILTGVGAGLFGAPNVVAIMNSVPVARRGVASGITSTMFNTGFLLSLGIAFAIMAASVPLSALQNIFAGLPVPPGQLNPSLFVDSMRKIFLLMGSISLIAAVPSSLRGSARSETSGAESVN